MTEQEQGGTVDMPGQETGMVHVAGGSFWMGSDDHYPMKRPRIRSASTASGSMQHR